MFKRINLVNYLDFMQKTNSKYLILCPNNYKYGGINIHIYLSSSNVYFTLLVLLVLD